MQAAIVLILSLLIFQAQSQTINYKFRIRYEDYSPLANSRFIINGEALATDPQGIISLTIPSQLNFVNIESSNVKAFQIKYPLDGRANLPKDPAITVDIYISKPAKDIVKAIAREVEKTQLNADAILLKKLQAQHHFQS